jgi:hypothetical protein
MQSGARPRALSLGAAPHSPGLPVARPAGRLASTRDVAGKVQRWRRRSWARWRRTDEDALTAAIASRPSSPQSRRLQYVDSCISHVAQRVWRHVRIEHAHDFGERLVGGPFYSTARSCQCGFQPRKRYSLPGEVGAWRRARKALTPGGGIHPESSIGQVAGWRLQPATAAANPSLPRTDAVAVHRWNALALSAYNCGLHCNVIFCTLQLNSVGFSV